MNKYKVIIQSLYWFDEEYEVLAESEEDIDESAVLNGELISSDINGLDQINSIDSIELIEENIEDNED